MDRVRSDAFYGEYHGHRIEHLEVVHSNLRLRNERLVFLAGDSSLDNKFWFQEEADALNGYEDILSPAVSRMDIAYAMNAEIVRRGMGRGRGMDMGMGMGMAVINCAIEESTVGARSCGQLLPQDRFVRNNIQTEDVLVISLGGNDIALKPTPCTALSVLSLLCCTTTPCISYSCGCALPCDDCCCGCGCGFASNFLAFPFGLGYLIHLFGTRIKAAVTNMTAKTRPKLILVCMIYFLGRCLKPNSNTVFLTYLHITYVSFIPYIPSTIYMTPLDEKPRNSWAEGVLGLLGYNKNPRKLQEVRGTNTTNTLLILLILYTLLILY
jgi:hypothetical protein